MIILVLSVVSCDFNAPLRNRMLNYYTEDSNYVLLVGEIKNIKYSKDNKKIFLEINIITSDHNIPTNSTTGYGEFAIINWDNYQLPINVGDDVVFTTAPMYFYDGHFLPIVHLEKDGQEYLSFSDGKEDYCNWIKESFK